MATRRKDPWEVLGLERGADAAAVKAAFRRAALSCHPDVNAAPEAAVRFAEVKRAADALLVSSGQFLCWASLPTSVALPAQGRRSCFETRD